MMFEGWRFLSVLLPNSISHLGSVNCITSQESVIKVDDLPLFLKFLDWCRKGVKESLNYLFKIKVRWYIFDFNIDCDMFILCHLLFVIYIYINGSLIWGEDIYCLIYMIIYPPQSMLSSSKREECWLKISLGHIISFDNNKYTFVTLYSNHLTVCIHWFNLLSLMRLTSKQTIHQQCSEDNMLNGEFLFIIIFDLFVMHM